MWIAVLVVLILNSISLFMDTPMWYTVTMLIVTGVVAIVVIKNSNIIKKLKSKK